MSEITIKEVTSRSEWKTFIYLPEKIHQNHPNWLHPLYIDEEKFFDKKKNPAFSHNDTVLFLAYQNNQAVGRILGIIPHEYNHKENTQVARFSYMECYEDQKVFDALIQAVEEWAKSKKCTQLIGPMGFSDKEPQGFVTRGFDDPTMLVTNCTFAYMKAFIEQRDYQPFVELYEYEVPIDEQVIHRYERFTKRVERNSDIKVVEFTRTKDVKPYVSTVFDLINESYQNIYGFTQVTEEEKQEFANRFLPLLNPQLIKIITNSEGKALAFVVAMADMSQGIRKAKGRLFPFGWYHIWRAAKKSKRLVLLLGGVHPERQNKGYDAILATRLFKSALKLGFKTMDSHLIMKDNTKMRAEIERLEGYRLYKEYTIYKKEIV